MTLFSTLDDTLVSLKHEGGLFIERRESAGKDSLGEDLPPAVVSILLDPVNVQPLEGADRLQEREGDRDSEQILLFSRQQLRTARGGTSRMADVVLYDAEGDGELGRYVVRFSAPWKVGSFFRCKAVREEAQ